MSYLKMKKAETAPFCLSSKYLTCALRKMPEKSNEMEICIHRENVRRGRELSYTVKAAELWRGWWESSGYHWSGEELMKETQRLFSCCLSMEEAGRKWLPSVQLENSAEEKAMSLYSQALLWPTQKASKFFLMGREKKKKKKKTQKKHCGEAYYQAERQMKSEKKKSLKMRNAKHDEERLKSVWRSWPRKAEEENLPSQRRENSSDILYCGNLTVKKYQSKPSCIISRRKWRKKLTWTLYDKWKLKILSYEEKK